MVRKLRSDELSELCRQIGALTRAGIPMVKAVEMLGRSAGNKRISNVYGELESMIRRGNSISSSMDTLGVFPELTVNMFHAAERSGQLEKTANRLAEYYRKEHQTETKIRTATMYPKLLCLMAFSVVLFVFLIIIPVVEPLFEGAELPVITIVLMGISKTIKDFWYLVIAGIVMVRLLVRLFLLNRRGKLFWDMICLHLPILGKQIRILYTARFARSLGSLYYSGVSMVESLSIAAKTIGNRYLEDQFLRVVSDVRKGDSLSQAVERVDGLDKKLPMIIRVGEETGELDKMLDDIADGYEYDAEMAMNRIIAMIEPGLIVLIGVVVAVILLGIMVPMWSMYEYIG